MLRPRNAVLAVLAAASLLCSAPIFAQQPAPEPPSNQPAPAPPDQPPAPPPGQQPAPPPDQQPAPPRGDQTQTNTFGQEIVLTEKTIIYMKGSANWDTAFETLVDTFKSLSTVLDKQGLKAAGPAMTIYTSIEDTGFQFQAAIPIAEEPKNLPPGDVLVGKSPAGKALKFVHHGSYDSMDSTYESITNYMDERRLESKDMFIEEYVTDLTTTPEDQLTINVLVPLNEQSGK
jgi:effector-binding domain-containing protein